MIVQSNNGCFYSRPTIGSDHWQLVFDEDGAWLLIPKNRSYRRALTELRKRGVKALTDTERASDDASMILGGGLVEATQWPLRIVEPIPKPDTYAQAIQGWPLFSQPDVMAWSWPVGLVFPSSLLNRRNTRGGMYFP